MKKVRWGLVSAGHIANTFAADIAHASNAEVVAVAARNLADARAFARKYGIPTAYEGYDRLFADDGIDAVYVSTPHTLHLTHSVAALQAGKSVLCEKPLTTSADECRRLLAVAAETGGYLMEAMWTWFLPAIRAAKAWFEAGRIGELRHIRAGCSIRPWQAAACWTWECTRSQSPGCSRAPRPAMCTPRPGTRQMASTMTSS
jgi:predicted dehydrogenase